MRSDMAEIGIPDRKVDLPPEKEIDAWLDLLPDELVRAMTWRMY